MPQINESLDAAIDTASRIVRLETKLDFIIAQMQSLPPSPTCVAHHAEANRRLNSLEAWRNRAVGVMLVVNIVLVVAVEKIFNFLGGK